MAAKLKMGKGSPAPEIIPLRLMQETQSFLLTKENFGKLMSTMFSQQVPHFDRKFDEIKLDISELKTKVSDLSKQQDINLQSGQMKEEATQKNQEIQKT